MDDDARRKRFEAIGEIAAEIAHELRNALQIVSANVYLARQSAGAPGASEPFLAKVERSTRIAQGIVDDLMALARGEAIHAEPYPVADLLPLGRELLLGEADHIDDVDPPDLEVRAHQGLAARLLHVLYENAIQASRPRRVGITTRARRAGDRVRIEVSDDGPGVPEKIRGTLFEPLVTERPGGTGLGLALARRIVDAHGGSIALRGASTFAIELPS
ncbi:MAG: HAMP domain-containing histidine kinase [Labilithrix sp.]|nr:HAMP domain-containing histidine kinase [Labilithrix sp.]MCW5817948.1 HAMP domain-containing histidine kinase [Labilithrix sp.]